MKIHLVGGCASGKTYIAKVMSAELGIPSFALDDLMWTEQDGKKYPDHVRDQSLLAILAQDDWIIEGVYHKWVFSSFEQADVIFVIQPPLFVRHYRTVKRFIRARLGLAPMGYRQSFKDLGRMLRWNIKYEKANLPAIVAVTDPFANKRFIVRDNLQVMEILKSLRSMNTC